MRSMEGCPRWRERHALADRDTPPSGLRPATSPARGGMGVIIGLGSDLCNIERIQAALDRHGGRFEARCFTDVEQAKAAKRPFTRAGTYAKRFAAKEAFSKAVGTGFKRGVFMKDIGVVNAPSGAPTLALSGGAKARLDAITPAGHVAKVHLTLTDDHPWAFAMVMIEAVKEG